MSANENNKFHAILDVLEETLTRLLRVGLHEMHSTADFKQTLQAAQELPPMCEQYETILTKVADDLEKVKQHDRKEQPEPTSDGSGESGMVE